MVIRFTANAAPETLTIFRELTAGLESSRRNAARASPAFLLEKMIRRTRVRGSENRLSIS